MNSQKAQGVIEYIFMITFIIVTFWILQKYIVHAFVGRWRETGETISGGRQFDPKKTIKNSGVGIGGDCAYIDEYAGVKLEFWYDVNKFEIRQHGTCRDICFGAAYEGTDYENSQKDKCIDKCYCASRSNRCRGENDSTAACNPVITFPL